MVDTNRRTDVVTDRITLPTNAVGRVSQNWTVGYNCTKQPVVTTILATAIVCPLYEPVDV